MAIAVFPRRSRQKPVNPRLSSLPLAEGLLLYFPCEGIGPGSTVGFNGIDIATGQPFEGSAGWAGVGETGPSLTNATGDTTANLAQSKSTYALNYPDPNRVTIAAKVRVSGASGRQTIYSCNDAASGVQLEIDATAGTTFTVNAIIFGTFVAQTSTTWPVNTWLTIVYVRRGSGATSEVWVNGVLATLATNTADAFANVGAQFQKVGNRNFSGTSATQSFLGSIEYCGVWARDLVPTEIMELVVDPYQLLGTPRSRTRFLVQPLVEGVTIDGIARSIRPDWSIGERLNERGTFRFTVPSLTGTVRPALRDVVNFMRDSVRLFAGTIHNTSEYGMGGRGLTPIDTDCGAVDFHALPERRQQSITLATGTLKSMLETIVPYFSAYGVTLHASQVTGPAVVALTFEIGPLSAVLDKLSVVTGYAWEIGYDKKLRMFAPGTDSASFNIIDGDSYVIGDLTVTPTTQQYGNHVTVLAGSGTHDVADSFTGDGVTTAFELNYNLSTSYGYVMNAAVAETLRITGDPDSATWEYNPSTGFITRLTGAPANGNAIVMTYVAQFPFEVTAEDVPAQQGGANLHELVFTHTEVMDITTAQALADGYLVRALVQPREIRYRTRSRVRVGQQQSITKSSRNVSGACLITQVDISMEGRGDTDAEGSWLNYDVVAVEGLVIPQLSEPGKWRMAIGGRL